MQTKPFKAAQTAVPQPAANTSSWLHEAVVRIEADYQRSGDASLAARGSGMEGIGRPVESPASSASWRQHGRSE